MKRYRLLLLSLAAALLLTSLKFGLHSLGWEGIVLGSLHTSVITGTFFVIGFLLSATIADYKESEKIPAEVAATIQDMYQDSAGIASQYTEYRQKEFNQNLLHVLVAFKQDVRNKTHHAPQHIQALTSSFISMEQAGVPANFIVKLKQQQAQLLRNMLRVTYIQRITFLPSATVLSQCIVILTTGLLLFTEVEPFYGGMALTAIISFILIYILTLINLISTPFHSEGKTQDDVSLFLIDQTIAHINSIDPIKKER